MSGWYNSVECGRRIAYHASVRVTPRRRRDGFLHAGYLFNATDPWIQAGTATPIVIQPAILGAPGIQNLFEVSNLKPASVTSLEMGRSSLQCPSIFMLMPFNRRCHF